MKTNITLSIKEIKIMFGAEWFVFYVNSVGKKIKGTLEYYTKANLIEVVDFKPQLINKWSYFA